MYLKDIKVGQYFTQVGNPIVWQKINPHGKDVNSILVKWNDAKCPLGDLPIAVNVAEYNHNLIREYFLCDKDGNLIQEKLSWSNCPLDKWLTCDDVNNVRSVYTKNSIGCVLHFVKNSGYCNYPVSFGENKCWAVIPRPDWVKLPD